MGVYSQISDHQSMVFDKVRNSAYLKAIQKFVTPGCRVLDLGAGLGVHGLMAASEGAHAILVDISPVIGLCREISTSNGLSNNTEIFRGRIEDLDLEEPVDVIVSVLTGNFLVTEDLLPILFRARNRFLKPGGRLIPDRALMQIALASADTFYKENVSCWSEPTLGLDFSPIRKFSSNGIYYSNAERMQAQLLSDAETLQELNFMTATSARVQGSVSLEAHSAGTCHGLVGWFDLSLGDSWLSTAPGSDPTHWSQVFFPLDPVIELEKGDKLDVQLVRPEFGDWTWTVGNEQRSQRHSTFNSRLQDLNFFKKQDGEYLTGLGCDGEIVLFVLKSMEQGLSVAEILSGVTARFPGPSERDPGLVHRVRRMIDKWDKNQVS